MPQDKIIEHEGVVIDRSDGQLTVEILVNAACGSCHAKQSCLLAEAQQKRIHVPDDGVFEVGQHVTVVMAERLGIQAVFLGYVWPSVILVAGLVLGAQVLPNELIAGIFAVSILIPYYVALYFFRATIKNQFTFRLKSSNT